MPWLIAIGGVMGIGMGAEYVMCYGPLTEFMPPERRGRYLGIFAGVGVSATSLLSLILIPLFSWRIMFVTGGIGTLIVWWLRRSLPESPGWLQAVGRYEEAETVLDRIAAECGVGGEHARAVRAKADLQLEQGKPAEWVPISLFEAHHSFIGVPDMNWRRCVGASKR